MNPFYPRVSAAVLVAVVLSAGAHAADLKGVTLGTWISGPKITPADLVGKVVIFEYWGINCPPCLANIPHISELAALAEPDRLLVVANQCQGPGSTAAVWTEKQGTGKPVVVDGGDLPGRNVSGIPRIFVFDHTGKQVFDGRPGDVDDAMITKLLDAAPGPLVAKGEYVACRAEVAALSAPSGNVASVLKTLRGKRDKGKDPAPAEAARLLDGVQSYLDKKLAAITAARSDDPVNAADVLTRTLARIKGDDLAKPFEALQAELKADKAFQAELAAATKLTLIADAVAHAGLDQVGLTASRKNDALAAVQAIDRLIKTYPDTKAAKAAVALRAKIGGG